MENFKLYSESFIASQDLSVRAFRIPKFVRFSWKMISKLKDPCKTEEPGGDLTDCDELVHCQAQDPSGTAGWIASWTGQLNRSAEPPSWTAQLNRQLTVVTSQSWACLISVFFFFFGSLMPEREKEGRGKEKSREDVPIRLQEFVRLRPSKTYSYNISRV